MQCAKPFAQATPCSSGSSCVLCLLREEKGGLATLSLSLSLCLSPAPQALALIYILAGASRGPRPLDPLPASKLSQLKPWVLDCFSVDGKLFALYLQRTSNSVE